MEIRKTVFSPPDIGPLTDSTVGMSTRISDSPRCVVGTSPRTEIAAAETLTSA